MNPTMNVSSEYVLFWFVAAPTLVLILMYAMSLSRELGSWLLAGWKRLRSAWDFGRKRVGVFTSTP